MWDIEAIAKGIVAIGTPLGAAFGFLSRRRRLRSDIRDNLALAEEIEKHDLLRDHTLASGWLQGRIALDIARITGQDLGAARKPINWSSVVIGALFFVLSAGGTYLLTRDGFVWYSVFPATFAFLCLIAVVQDFTNRELPPEDASALPLGAVRARTDTEEERVATAVAMAASGGIDDRLNPGGQAYVALRFLKLLQLGAYEAALPFVDDNWIRCRVFSWLWNNRSVFGHDSHRLLQLAESMLVERGDNENWRDFVAVEKAQFVEAWGQVDFDLYGVASRRRRISRDLDLVILAYVGVGGGYFVTTATAITNAFTILVSRHADTWRVSNHAGVATPLPDWPPVWWLTDDPAIEALPEPHGVLAEGRSHD